MRSVRSSRNKTTELALMALWKRCQVTGWRRNRPLPGKPDFVFPKIRIVVFADGCFWHGHNCRNTKPKRNKEFWEEKFRRNRTRDRKVNALLRRKGWRVFRIWECAIQKGILPSRLMRLLRDE